MLVSYSSLLFLEQKMMLPCVQFATAVQARIQITLTGGADYKYVYTFRYLLVNTSTYILYY